MAHFGFASSFTPIFASVTLVGCIASTPSRHPLYEPSSPPLPREHVAELTGYVQFVDGRDVSPLGTSFELLPGCHIVQTPTQWGHTELNQGGLAWNTGNVTYAFPMKGGHTYTIKADARSFDGTHHWVKLNATELDSAGVVTKTFHPVSSNVTRCPSE